MIKLIFIGLLFSGCGKPITEKKMPAKFNSELLRGVSTKIILDLDMSLNFDLLPLEGFAKRKEHLWSGDSWPLTRRAINYRWNSVSGESINDLSPTRREVAAMSLDDLKKLSPSEKYDLLQGRYDYPLKKEVYHLSSRVAENWEGLCHGFAGASLNHRRPVEKELLNPDGIKIPFGVSDIKALLTYTYSKILIQEGQRVGKRCELKNDLIQDNCDNDLTAVAFHAVITNKMGLRGESLIADVERYQEVWNHPLISYESKIISMIGKPTGRIATISTKLMYVGISNRNSWGQIPDVINHMFLSYTLVLDHAGNMVSGEWLTNERPDFLWTVSRPEVFEGYLSDVIRLVK